MILRALMLSFCVLFSMTPHVWAGGGEYDDFGEPTQTSSQHSSRHSWRQISTVSEEDFSRSSVNSLRRSMLVDGGATLGGLFAVACGFAAPSIVDTLPDVSLLMTSSVSLGAKVHFCWTYASGDFVTVDEDGKRLPKGYMLYAEALSAVCPIAVSTLAVWSLSGTVDAPIMWAVSAVFSCMHLLPWSVQFYRLQDTSLGSVETRSLLDV